MGQLIVVFFLFYVAAFFLLYLLPKWKVLIPTSILAFAAVGWLWQDTFATGDGPSVIGAGFLLIFISIGLLSGFIGRVILLVTHQWLGKSVKTETTGLLTFILVPIVIFGIIQIYLQIG